MKSSTAERQQSEATSPLAPTRAQVEAIAAVEGLVLTDRMRRILNLPLTNTERRALIKATFRKT